MPELPDVDAVKRRIERKIKGKKIKDVKIYDKKLIRWVSLSTFEKTVKGNTIVSVDRRGKFLIFNLKSGDSMVGHLKMTGDFRYLRTKEKRDKYDKIILNLNDKHDLRYFSKRRLGMLTVARGKNFWHIPTLKNMGPEPLDNKFTFEVFKKILKGRKREIKPLLLDQSFIAGIGNVYADEILFHSRINPKRKVSGLSEKNKKDMFKYIKSILGYAVKHYRLMPLRRDFIINHREEGTPCPRCKTPLKRVVIASRSAYFCPRCQNR